jgi:hypothetical protein
MEDVSWLFKWQTLIGAMVGASAPFALWWFTEWRRRKWAWKEDVLYLNKAIADQVNLIIEIREAIKRFSETKLIPLIQRTEKENGPAYSVGLAFFPLFSTRGLNEDFIKKSSGSSYLDNKLARVYHLSQDLPHIIEDTRMQFQETLKFNKEISFGKLNSADAQRQMHLENLREYRRVLEEELLGQNLSIILKNAVEGFVGITEIRKIGVLGWRLKFDVRYRFFLSRENYKKERDRTLERIEEYFHPAVEKQIAELSKEGASQGEE